MPTIVDLGFLRLHCPIAALNLSISNSVQISAGEKLPLHNLADILLDPCPPWIEPDIGVRLVLDIALQGHITDVPSKLSLQDQLIGYLRETPLWHRLNLKPSLTVTPLTQSDSLARITVALSPLFPKTDKTHETYFHRLFGEGVPNYNIKPPTGITCLALEEVRLEMRLSSEDLVSSYLPSQTIPERAMVPESLRTRLDLTDILYQSDLAVDLRMPSTESNVYMGMLDEIVRPVTVEKPGHHDRPSASHLCYAETQSSTDWAQNVQQETPQRCALDVEVALSLIDAALRLSISSVPFKLLPGLGLVETASFRRLDKLFPASWRPEYLPAVAARAVFIPTISHAISHLSRRSILSKSLEDKLAAITQRATQKNNDGHREKYEDDHSQRHAATLLQHATSIQLWAAVQRHSLASTAEDFGVRSTYRATHHMYDPDAGNDAASTTEFE